jgi:hypothetical protein
MYKLSLIKWNINSLSIKPDLKIIKIMTLQWLSNIKVKTLSNKISSNRLNKNIKPLNLFSHKMIKILKIIHLIKKINLKYMMKICNYNLEFYQVTFQSNNKYLKKQIYQTMLWQNQAKFVILIKCLQSHPYLTFKKRNRIIKAINKSKQRKVHFQILSSIKILKFKKNIMKMEVRQMKKPHKTVRLNKDFNKIWKNIFLENISIFFQI